MRRVATPKRFIAASWYCEKEVLTPGETPTWNPHFGPPTLQWKGNGVTLRPLTTRVVLILRLQRRRSVNLQDSEFSLPSWISGKFFQVESKTHLVKKKPSGDFH